MEAVQGVKRPHPENGDAQGDGAKRFQSLNGNGVADNSGTTEFGGKFMERGNGGGREFVRRGVRGFQGRGFEGEGGFGRGRGMRGRGGFGWGLRNNFRGKDNFSSREGSNMDSNYSSSSKVYRDFPDWSADQIHNVLHNIDYIESPRTEPDQTIWNRLIKEVNPTFKTVLHYCKKMLLSVTKKVEVEGLPQKPVSLAEVIKEKANLLHLNNLEIYQVFNNTMCPSERCQYYVHNSEMKKKFDMMWFNYYKEKPEEFQKLCEVRLFNNYRDFELNF